MCCCRGGWSAPTGHCIRARERRIPPSAVRADVLGATQCSFSDSAPVNGISGRFPNPEVGSGPGEERSLQPPKSMCIAGASNYFDIFPRWLKTISGAIRESRSLSPLRRAAEKRPGRAGRPAPLPPNRRSQPSHANGAPLTRGGPRTEEEEGEGAPGFRAKSRHRKKSPGGHGGRKSTGI